MNSKLIVGFLFSATVALLAAPGVEMVFQPVALSGQLAPGLTNNVKFDSFEDVSLADDGRVAFTGRLTGTGVTSTNGQGLWAGLPGGLRLLLRTGDLVPGDTNGNTFTYFWNPNIDNHQAVGFLAIDELCSGCQAQKLGQLRLTRSIDQVFLPTNGQLWIDYRVPEPVLSSDPLGSFILGHIVNAGAARVRLFGPDIGFINNQAILAGPSTNVAIVARTGFPAPGVSGNFTFFPDDSQALALTRDGNVAFKATATDGDGIWFGKAGTVQLVALRNRPAPASLLGPGYTFGVVPAIENVEVNARGELAFATYLAGPGLNDTNRVFVVAGPPGGLRVIAQSGQPARGIPGAVFAYFSHVLLGTDGTAAFTGRYTTNGTDLVSGLWLAPTNGAPPILLMHAGQRAPGTPADVYFKSSVADEAYFMNSRNQVVFRSLLAGPGFDHFDKGIWLAEPDGTVSLIVRKGDMVDTGNGVMAKVSNVSFGAEPEFVAGPEDGRRTPFNNRGEVALQIYFDAPPFPLTGSGGLFIVQTGINLRAERIGNDIRLKFPTLEGRHYRMDYRTNLSVGSWSVLSAVVTGTGEEVTVTDTNNAGQQTRFYRAARLD